jgi:hypothetical protein
MAASLGVSMGNFRTVTIASENDWQTMIKVAALSARSDAPIVGIKVSVREAESLMPPPQARFLWLSWLIKICWLFSFMFTMYSFAGIVMLFLFS